MRTIAYCLAILSCAIAANAQTTFNYFDPADVDEYGFLWFDTQAKLEKYCGVSSDVKVRLIPATYNDSTGQPAKPSLDATVRGWNLEGVLGGDGSHTGAIILPETDFSITWLTEVNGGGILMQFPDLAKLDLFVSCQGDPGWTDDERTTPGNFKDMYGALYGGIGTLSPQECSCIDIWYDKRAWGKVLSDTPMYYWKDIDTHQAWQYDWENEYYRPIWLGNKGAGVPITAYIINNNKTKWYIHGIRAYTYADTWASVRDISTSTLDITVKGSTITTTDSAAIEVCSTTGTTLRRGRGTIDCSTLPHGIYIIKATDGKTTLTRKIVF